MTSRTTKAFRGLLAALPLRTRRHAAEAYRLFQYDIDHPGLEFKRLRSIGNLYSARIGLSYRAVCRRRGDTVVWFWIGTHADYDRLLRGL